MAERLRTPIVPSASEQGDLRSLTEALLTPARERLRLIGPGDEAIELPESAQEVLRQATEAMARGLAVMIIPSERELTTQQAASVLNVSRQYLVELLEAGRIPFHKTGTHRRIRYDDLLAFREARDRRRREGLRQLTRLSEELGMYADDFPTVVPDER